MFDPLKRVTNYALISPKSVGEEHNPPYSRCSYRLSGAVRVVFVSMPVAVVVPTIIADFRSQRIYLPIIIVTVTGDLGKGVAVVIDAVR